ncbi:unknown [[Mannheimia] succiniciproducens MBEL55E]|uniref:Uncharacterized protein n=1 Tax=Mannheimia succiniciproducens (strain KCTC 0769BP / MBEL55E) TaxID=221988 RepID=Q65QL5_MANSM|nr:unknown [[Mannheimia] succiniciproducens MBEL55E]
MEHEVCHRHLTSQDKCGKAGEQAQDDEDSAQGFDDAAYAH